jgi:glycogen debranching enzyme
MVAIIKEPFGPGYLVLLSLGPLRDHFREAGLNHISEIADAEPPHTPRGCAFQAWSMGEYLRLLAALSQ